MKKKLVLYGDSNTYGYDPRGFLGMRYPESVRWPTLIRPFFDAGHRTFAERFIEAWQNAGL